MLTDAEARYRACVILAEAYNRAINVPGLSAEDRKSLNIDLAACERIVNRRKLVAA